MKVTHADRAALFDDEAGLREHPVDVAWHCVPVAMKAIEDRPSLWCRRTEIDDHEARAMLCDAAYLADDGHPRLAREMVQHQRAEHDVEGLGGEGERLDGRLFERCPHPVAARLAPCRRNHLGRRIDAMGAPRGSGAIVVREILDRANVGRSTFYAHFRDKDDLLLGAIRDVLRATMTASPPAARRSERVVRFSRPMIAHIGVHFRPGARGMPLRSRAIVHERLRQVLAECVAEEVRRGGTRAAASSVPTDLLVQHVTSTFILVLEWWLQSGGQHTPDEVDALFRSLALPAVVQALD